VADVPTFNKWQKKKKKKKKKKKTLHMLTHGTMQVCGLTSLVVSINERFCDVRKRNVTIRSDI
jgi:preprotein translocase subunit YajC